MKKYLTVLKQLLRLQRPDSLKVVVYCIITAATFWLFSALNKQYDASVRYPVAWEFDSDSYIVIDELPEDIQMNVSGLGWNLLRANSGLGLIPINLRLTDPATNKRLPGSYFSNQVAEALDELQLNYIIQDSLIFNIDHKIKRSFPIYVDSINVDLEEGYRITSPINFSADLIEIEGPKTILESMPKDTFWLFVIESDIDADFKREVPLQLEYPDLMLAKPTIVEVDFKVDKFIDQQIELPINYTNTERLENIFVKDSLIIVHYLIQENFKDSINSEMLFVEADFNLINKLDSTLTLNLKSDSKLIVAPYFNFPQVKVYYNE